MQGNTQEMVIRKDKVSYLSASYIIPYMVMLDNSSFPSICMENLHPCIT